MAVSDLLNVIMANMENFKEQVNESEFYKFIIMNRTKIIIRASLNFFFAPGHHVCFKF